MANVVLVHGAFLGTWVWSKITPSLMQAGHNVVCATLTGLGSRAHELTAQTGLDVHIHDVCNVIDKHDLSKVVLVGHSYGGVVISGVAKERVHALSHLVYLDAAVPDNGQSLLDIIGHQNAQAFIDSARQTGDGWKVAELPPEAFGLIDQKDTEWAIPLLRPQPLKSFTDKVSTLSDAQALQIATTYIHCTLSNPFMATQAAKAIAKGWRCLEIPTPHSPMITHPELFIQLMITHILNF